MTWPTKKLIDVSDLERGTEPGSAFYVEASDNAIPFLRVGDLTGKVNALRFVKNDNGNLQINIINENETLITFDGTPGIVVRGFKGAIASGIRVIRNIKPEVNGNFLYYYLQTPSVQKTIKVYSKGATIIHASSAIQYIKIPLPPLKIQKQIVERLDKIAEAQKLNDDLIQKSDELFQSLLHRELDSAGKNWEVRKLGEVCDVRDGTHESPKFQPSGIPLVTSKNLIDNRIDFENINYISQEDHKGIDKRSKVDNGDILFAMIGTIGNPVVVKKDREFSIKNVGLIKFVKNSPISQYIQYSLLSSYVQKQIKLYSRGGTQKFVSLGNLRNLKIPLPPLKTQRQIVAKLSAVQDYKTQLLAQRAKLKELFESVLHKSMKNG